MNEFIYLLGFLNIPSLSIAIYFWRKSRQIKKKETLELQEFLADLLAGGSLIHVQRIAAADSLIHMRNRHE